MHEQLEASEGKWVKGRILVCGLVAFGVLGLHVRRAHFLQVESGEHFRELAEEQYLRQTELPPRRGAIHDRNGSELATSADVDSVYCNPRLVPAGAASRLAPALGMPLREVEEKLRSRRFFAWLKRRVPKAEAERVGKLEIAGVVITKEPRRYYPNAELAGPLLGFTDSDGNGIEGIEKVLDATLAGERREMSGMRDALGRDLVTEAVPDVEETSGQSVSLTIDRFVQFTAERVLKATVEKFRAQAGTAILLDVRTGEVLASATYPTYDPNKPGELGAGAPGAPKVPARNRAVTDGYEPGSTVKTFTIAAALDAGVVKPTDPWNTTGGVMKIGKYTIHDSHAHGILSTAEVLKVSSNIGAAKIGKRLGAEGLYDALRAFGFGQRTGIEMPGEQAGRLRKTESWGDIGLATVAFGQGLTATPLQIANAYATIANGGVWHAPRIVRGSKAPAERRAIDVETADVVRRMLESVTDEGGTAATLRTSLYKIAGKTGTAQKVDPGTRRYSASKYISSFAGFAPAHAPRIAMVVAIDEPVGQHFGSVVAAPAFQQIAEETLRYLGVAPADTARADAVAKHDAAPVRASARKAKAPAVEPAPELDSTEIEADADAVPDFTGMTMVEALAAGRRVGVALEIEGTGRAVSQSLEPGTGSRGGSCRISFAAPATLVVASAPQGPRRGAVRGRR